MILKSLTLIGGLAGAAGLSQYPEFSQQYVQRLAGQIEALDLVVADFDASALRSGLTRGEALSQMTGTPFLDDRRADMTRTFLRFETLSADYAQLTQASPMQRMTMPHRIADPETFEGTLRDYVPALPLSLASILSACIGYLLASLGLAGLFGVITRPFRRSARA